MRRRYRLAYLSGPIDAAKVFREWRGNQTSDYFGTVYLAHLYALLDDFSADALIITTLPGQRTRQELEHLTIVNIPMPTLRGIAYHFAMVVWAARCVLQMTRYRARAALLTAGHDYFWVFSVLRLFRIRIMVSLHGALWPKYSPRRLYHRALTSLNGLIFYPLCEHIQGVSEVVIAQVRESSSRLHSIPIKFVPTYQPARFADARLGTWPPDGERFNLLYVGRVEANKGVFDLVEIMKRLDEIEPGRFGLSICGEGSATELLLETIAKADLSQAIHVHGQCASSTLHKRFAESHAVVVPTRSDLEEGYAKVAGEAVLSLRPVVTSAACPALADVAPAAVEARVDDVDDYVRAILALARDPELYASKVEAAAQCRNVYFNEQNSYGAVLRGGLQALIAEGQHRAVDRRTAQKHG